MIAYRGILPYSFYLDFTRSRSCNLHSAFILYDISFQWGRSGHCAGSVWYHFTENESSVFFSGDYTENTQVYACDPIRDRQADLAVLDCAYGFDETPYNTACDRLLMETERLFFKYKLLLYPVHLNHTQFERLKDKNNFKQTIPYHSEKFSARQEIIF